MMHSSGYRANALLTFAVTILAFICAIASFSDNLNTPTPTSNVQVLNINRFQKKPDGDDGDDEASENVVAKNFYKGEEENILNYKLIQAELKGAIRGQWANKVQFGKDVNFDRVVYAFTGPSSSQIESTQERLLHNILPPGEG